MSAAVSRRALKVTPAGEATEVDLGRGSDSLLEMYAAIGCDVVECVQLADDVDMWVDEEGLLKAQLEPNLPASMLAWRYRGMGQAYYGTALFTGGADGAGNSLGLSDEALAQLRYQLDPDQETS
jgi:hypothetical protein